MSAKHFSFTPELKVLQSIFCRYKALTGSARIKRKSSCVNARGMLTAAYQVPHLLPEVGYPPGRGTPPARSDSGDTRGVVPPPQQGHPLARSNGGYPRWGIPQQGTPPGQVWRPEVGYPPSQVQCGVPPGTRSVKTPERSLFRIQWKPKHSPVIPYDTGDVAACAFWPHWLSAIKSS